MHLSLSLLASSIAVSSAFATTLPRQTIPDCALTCISDADLGGCAATDNVCLCESQVFIDSIEACLDETCSAQDLEDAREFIESVCDSVGVPIQLA